MKRVVVFLLSFSLLLLSGCGNSVAASNFLSVFPWTPASYVGTSILGEEVCEYKFTRYAGKAEDGKIITKPESKLIYTLKEGYSFEMSEGTPTPVANDNATLLTVKLNIAYENTDDVHEIYRGKTESITSYCSFNRYDLTPKLTYRNAETVEAAHTLYLDYNQKKATLNDALGEETLNIKSSGYDNESLYYLLRALNNITPGGSTTLSLFLAYDDFKYGNSSVKSKGIIQSTASDLVDVEVEPSVYSQFSENSEGGNKVSCYQTSVGLNTAKSGPATKLYYSTQKTRIASAQINSVTYETKNVLIKFEYPLYGYLSGSLALDYTQVFQLVKYMNR